MPSALSPDRSSAEQQQGDGDSRVDGHLRADSSGTDEAWPTPTRTWRAQEIQTIPRATVQNSRRRSPRPRPAGRCRARRPRPEATAPRCRRARLAVVGDRVVGRRRDEDQVALGDLLGVARHRHRAGAAYDDVDLLGLLVGAQRLLGAGGEIEPGNRHVPRAELPGIHEDVCAQAVPLLHRRL